MPEYWSMIHQADGKPALFRDSRVRRSTDRDPRYLSPLWEQRLTQNGALVFFYCPVGRSTPIDPRGCPEGWGMRLDENGRVYFANAISRCTTSVDPRALPHGWKLGVHQPTGLAFFESSVCRQVQDPRADLSEDEVNQLFNRDWNAWWNSRE